MQCCFRCAVWVHARGITCVWDLTGICYPCLLLLMMIQLLPLHMHLCGLYDSPKPLLCGPPGQQTCCQAPNVCVGGAQCVNLGSNAQMFVPQQVATQQRLQSDRPTCAGDTRLVGGVCCPSDSVCLSSCCASTQMCFRGTVCCAQSQQCGTSCCPTGQVCVGKTTCCAASQACGTTCW